MITRWDPIREMISMRNAVDRMFDSTLAPAGSLEYPATTWGLALDVVEDEEGFTVKASVPGLSPEEIEITFTDNVLTIKGEIKDESEQQDVRYHLRERRYGSFVRSLTVGARINADKIEANYDKGVLTLHLPKTEEVKPRRIAIQANGAKVIEAKAKK
jgi:HSP20 family protein